MIDDLKQILTGKLNHKNFSEEVDILSESVAGKNMSTYVIKNKNDITFQLVPGMPYQREQGKMGFVNGDKSRPVLLGASKRPNAKNASPVRVRSVSVVSDPGFPIVDLTPSVKWDIKLDVSNGPSCTGTSIQAEAVEAL